MDTKAFDGSRDRAFRIVPALSFLLLAVFSPTPSQARERIAVVTVRVDLSAPTVARQVRLWIPYPMSDENQDISDVSVSGNYAATAVTREGAFGNAILFAEWNTPGIGKALVYSFRVRRKEIDRKDVPEEIAVPGKEELGKYLAPTRLGPTDGVVREYADRITQGKKTVPAKAAAVYGWIVENMYRDPEVKGCGFGDVGTLLKKLGGKCADIHSVFVALSRAAGIPAREVFGIRLPKGKEGDMTKAQHCWAEFHVPGHGWVPVDPADVRKAILEKKISLEEAKPLREYYFGGIDENRIAFGTGRDIRLNPPQAGEALNYFMYPYAEADGLPLNEDLYGFNIGYRIEYREL